MKFANNGCFIPRKECPISDTADIISGLGFFWKMNKDTIMITSITGTVGLPHIDTIMFMYVEKFSESKINGSYLNIYPRKEGDFTLKICE